MRTTLTIDDDLAGILHRRSEELNIPFKELVNSALRKGLADQLSGKKDQQVVVRPHDFGSYLAGAQPVSFNHLADDLDLQDYLGNLAKDDSPGS